jgi:hypothetical protein
MYTGHVAIALAARGVRRDAPLWALILAAQGCDWVELVVHPFTPTAPPDLYSHAYPFVVIAAVIAALVVWVWRRSVAPAVTVLLVYLSHPLADFVTGFKPLWFGGPSVGLWFVDRPVADFVVQAALCVVGYTIYRRSLPAVRRRTIAAAAPLVLLLVLQALSDVRLEIVHRRRLMRRGEVALASAQARDARPQVEPGAAWAGAGDRSEGPGREAGTTPEWR